MLLELVIRDLALLEHVTLGFGPGLNVITGETGAGKSLLVGALELLVGQRPRPGLVREGKTRAVVEGRFAVPTGAARKALEAWLAEHLPQVALDWSELEAGEEPELILGRVVGRDGRTRAYVDQKPVTRRLLADLAGRLFEIHGQNDHQRLFDAGEQLVLLDQFGKLEEEVRDYRAARAHWMEHVQRGLRLEEERRERQDRLDMLRYQLHELEQAAPQPEEREALGPERALLRHAEELQSGLAAIVGELSEDDAAIVDRVRSAELFLEGWSERVEALGPPVEELAAARVHLDEAARALRSIAERLEVDPARLEIVEARLAELERLERKHGTDTAGLAAKRSELADELAALEADEASLTDLGTEIALARAALLELGGGLRRARKGLKAKLVRSVARRLRDLGLADAEFDLRLGQRGDEPARSEDGETDDVLDRRSIEADMQLFGERGVDRIEFLLAANPGEPKHRLRQVASGGEMARIMLALRGALAGADRDRTLVFDEIDSGVGGRLGPAVGRHLGSLAKKHQVLCVTHLPAVAAAADRHLHVSKVVHEGRTLTRAVELTGDQRVQEIADMIAGGADFETARAEARRLLNPK